MVPTMPTHHFIHTGINHATSSYKWREKLGGKYIMREHLLYLKVQTLHMYHERMN
jgi:hypothetical protein